MLENKLKNAAEKIEMSDEMKNRIIQNCGKISENIDTDGYTDHVYDVETIKPRKWLKIVSGIAACAVIAGGIGVGAYYISRQGMPSQTLDIVEEDKSLIFGDLDEYTVHFDESQEVRITNGEQEIDVKEYLKICELIETERSQDDLRLWCILENGNKCMKLCHGDILEYTENINNSEATTHYYELHSENVMLDFTVKENQADENSGNRLIIDNIMEYKYDMIHDEETWSELFLNTIKDYLENNEVIETDNLDYDAGTAFKFSDGKCSFELFSPDILAFYDEEHNVTYYDLGSDLLIQQLGGCGIKEAAMDYGSRIMDEKNKVQYWDCKLDSPTLDMNDAMKSSLCEYMEKQTVCGIPNEPTTVFYVSIKDENDNLTASVSVYSEGCMTYEEKIGGMTYRLYEMTCDVDELMAILYENADTEEKHDTDNAAYYFPGGNFLKSGNADYECEFVGNGTLTDEQSAQLQDIFYGYDWAAHEVTDVSDFGLVSVFSFKWKNVNGAERHINVCEDGYIFHYNRSEENYDEHIYKFDNTEIEDNVRKMFGF